jgi:hypothetical protein
MPTSFPKRKAPIDVTSGEILAGVIWLVFFCLLVVAVLSTDSRSFLIAAIR